MQVMWVRVRAVKENTALGESHTLKILVDGEIQEILSEEETLQLEPEDVGFSEDVTVGREQSSWMK